MRHSKILAPIALALVAATCLTACNKPAPSDNTTAAPADNTASANSTATNDMSGMDMSGANAMSGNAASNASN